MTPCRCGHVDSVFTPRIAAREARRYRERGPDRATRVLIDALIGADVRDATLLDVGGGVGAIQHELLRAGAAHSASVDAASSYRAELLAEAVRQGHDDRITAHDGDFVELAPTLEPADIVTLDKVICCDPDVDELVQAVAAGAQRLIGLVYPRDTLPVRAGGTLLNLGLRLFAGGFRWFVHPTSRVDGLLREAGFERTYVTRGARLLPWEIAVYERVASR